MKSLVKPKSITFGGYVADTIAAASGLLIARGTVDIPVWCNRDGTGIYRIRYDPRIIIQGFSAISDNQGLYSALNAAPGNGTARFAFITPGGVFSNCNFFFTATALDTR